MTIYSGTFSQQIPDPSCSCGAAKQTMSHTVNDCPLSRFPGSVTTLHLAGDEAISGWAYSANYKNKKPAES